MKALNFKTFLPHLIAIGIFFLIVFAYFKPVFLEKKEVKQGDVINFLGMSKELVNHRNNYHEEALWTNSMFGGMPAYQISVFYKGNLVKYVDTLLTLNLPRPANYVFLYMLGFYILLIVLGVDPKLGIVGAIGFGLSSYFFIILEVGHNSKAHAIGYMAPVLAGILLTYRGKFLLGGALTALFLSLEISANHPQITYYLFLFLMIYFIAEFVNSFKQKKIKDFIRASAVLVIAGVFALTTNIASLWATYDYGKYTTRGGTELTINETGKSNSDDKTHAGLDPSYITAWSYDVGETMTLMIPNFKGGASDYLGNNKEAIKKVDSQMREAVANFPQYWGKQPFTSGPVYAGAIIVFLFVLGLLLVEGYLKWAIFAGTILSIWLSWGKNDPLGLSDFFIHHFPMYNKFRAVSMILVVAELTIPLLAILTLDKILKTPDFFKQTVKLPLMKNAVPKLKLFYATIAFTGGISLLLYITPSTFTSFTAENEYDKMVSEIKRSQPDVKDAQIKQYLENVMPEVETVRETIFRSDAGRTFLFILIAAGVLFFYSRKMFNGTVLAVVLGILVLADLWFVDYRYLNKSNYVKKKEMENPFAAQGRPNAADEMILQDKDPNFRVWNQLARLDQDAGTSYFHKSLGGYHGAKLRRYQELIDFHLSKNNRGVMNMLNTKYVIRTGQDNQPVALQNHGALGNAWFVNEYKIVANADSEITAMTTFDPEKTAIIDKRFGEYLKGLTPKKDSAASFIKLESYKPNDLIYTSKNSGEGLAVFSEIYFSNGWNVYVDGKLTPHFRANYVLRAMRIPAGEHKVEFKFEPTIYFTGEKISYASSVLLLLLVGGVLFKSIVHRR